MLKVIVDNHIPFVLMGIFVATGVISKFIVSITLKKLVKAASDMSKSSHALMRLVRAKFEHACMISDKVQNVEAFAQKYLYEYKVLGMRLHRLQRMETGSAWLCLITGMLGSWAAYHLYGMNESVFRMGVTGAVEAVLLFLLHKTTDEKYQLEVIKNYMVDYLENVCARRLEKTMKKEEHARAYERTNPDNSNPDNSNPEINNPERPRPRNEVPSPLPIPGMTEPVMPTPNQLPTPNPVQDSYSLPEMTQSYTAETFTKSTSKPNTKKLDKQEERKEKKDAARDVRIREILEEFLA